MSNHRNVFVVTVLIAVTLSIGGYFYYTSDKVQNRLKSIIEEELSSQFGGTISIGNYTIGLLAVSADSISVSHSFNTIDLSIEKIRIGFSLQALFSPHWEPEKLIDEITLLRPELTITLQNPSQDSSSAIPLTADEISAQILNNLPLRRVAVKQCRLTIVTPKNQQIIQFDNLNGTILRKNDNLLLTLDGSSKKRQNTLSIQGTLSRDIKQQYLSIKSSHLPFSTTLGKQSGVLSAQLTTDMTLNFSSAPYPQALLPTGSIDIAQIRVAFNGDSLITSGEISLVADSGEISEKKILLNSNKYQVHGDLSLSLAEGGVASFELKNILDTTTYNTTTFSITPSHNHFATFTTQGQIASALGPIALEGEGVVAPHMQGVTLSSLFFRNQWFHGGTKGQYDTSGNYTLYSDFVVDKSDSTGTTKGIGYLSLQKNNGVIMVKGALDSLAFTKDSVTFSFPTLQITTQKHTIKLLGEDSLLSLKAHLVDTTFSLEGTLTKQGVDKLKKLTHTEKFIDSGTVNFSVTGNQKSQLITTRVEAQTPYGDLSLLGSSSHTDTLFTAAIDEGVWRYKNIEIPFSSELIKNDTKVLFTVHENLKRFKMKGVYYFDTKHFKKIKMKLSHFPASWANVLFDEGSIPVQDGTLSGDVSMNGKLTQLTGTATLSLANLKIGDESQVSTDLSLSFDSSGISAAPFFVRNATDTLFSLEQFHWGNSLRLYGTFNQINLTKLTNFPGGPKIEGVITGNVLTLNNEALLFLSSDSLTKGQYHFDNFFAQLRLNKDSLFIDSLSTSFFHLNLVGSLAKAYKDKNKLAFKIQGKGDFLATLDSLTEQQYGGKGEGSFVAQGTIADGELALTKARAIIPQGTLHITPYTQGDHIENFYGDIRLLKDSKVRITMRGELDRKMLVIKNSFATNDSILPFTLGNLNFGVLTIFTDKGGVPLHVPGYMENRRNNMGYFETAGTETIPHFTLSGPFSKPHIWGTILLQKLELTYPPLKDYEERESHPLNLTYHLNVRAKGRSVTYFYQLGLKRSRRAPRIIECTIDPSEEIMLRGNIEDETFKIEGGLRSYKGSLFYGTWFDQNFELGLDFSPESRVKGGYNNAPIIWGSAETYSDSSRLEKVQVKVMTKDSITGVLRPKGRFTEIVITPSTQANALQSQGEEESNYHKLTSQNFTDGAKAGDMVTDMGDKYMSSYFFNYWGRQLARKLGLDMIRIESSMMNNSFDYFHQKSLGNVSGTNFEQIALANTGITVGKYLFGSDIFFKWRTEFGTQDSIIVPEYKIGLEYQPIPYLWMDFNYGLSKDAYTDEVLVNPEVRLQLRLPLRGKKEPK